MRSHRRRRTAALAVAAAALLALTACTGVPDSSTPQTIGPVRLDRGDTGSAAAPQRNASPLVIVTDFLDANSADPTEHTSARLYLTRTARNQWSDQRVTIIADRQIQNYNPAKGTVEVTGRVIGTINANGIYQPSNQGIGEGGSPTVFPFTLKKESGQFRIDQLRSGLLITDDQFRTTYQQHVIYYYDLSEKYLVPDIRWSEIPSTDSGQLATWLVDQLVSAPRPELTDVVSTDTFPAQVDSDRIIVRTSNGNIRTEIPGSSQLDPDVLNRLAEQLARTLDDVLSGGTLTITDNGAPVYIPQVATTTFTADAFNVGDGPATDVYYLNSNGHVTDQNGHTVSGPLSHYYLTSVALSRSDDTGALQVAATEGSGSDGRLFLGSQTAGLHSTSVHGTLTRPAWSPIPGLHEVWIGVGSTIHRITVSGSKYKDSVVQFPPTSGGGQIRSVRLSPDGTQIALVLTGAAGTGGALYVGAVVRDAGTVRISGIQPVSPAGVVVTDADWSNSQRLAAIGYIGSAEHGEVYDLGADGSFWVNRGFRGLPEPPASITASTYGTWVEAGNQIWYQSGPTWSSPSTSGQAAYGNRPVFVS